MAQLLKRLTIVPTKAKRVCNGCGRSVHNSCVECHLKRRRRIEKGRPSSSQRGYGATWRRLRQLVLHRYPMCNECKRKPSEDVDHIRPKADGGEDTMENLQGLCRGCHNNKTAQENSIRGGGSNRYTP